jgi:hypothetical protein
MANKEIHQLPPKTNISDTSQIPFDEDLGGGVYEASSITWLDVLTNAIRGFAKLTSNNVFTGTNRFNKQVKVVSDGTNSPLVVRNSTDTTTIAEITKEGHFKNTYFWQFFNLTGGGSYEFYSQTTGFEVRKNGVPFMMLDTNEQKFGNINTNTSLFAIRTNNAYGGEYPLGAVLQSLGTNGSIILSPLNGASNKALLGYYDGTQWRSALEYNNTNSGFTIVKILRSGGQLIIGGTTPDATAVFQIDSTTKGILIPRMTTTQRNAIVTPATGLELWDTTANTKSYKKSGGWSYAGLITETQYDRPYIGVDITVTNGSEFNLLTKIAETDKNNTVTDAFNPLVIASNNIKTQWTGAKQIHFIRLNFDVLTGNEQFYRVELRRFSDNSVVATKIVSRNPDEPHQTVEFITRTLSATDPYVTGGFYITFVNNSGATCTVQDAFQLLIINQYQ